MACFIFLWQQGRLAKSRGYHELCDLRSWKKYFLRILSNWFILYLPTPRDLTYTLSTLGVHDRRKPQSWEWVGGDTPPHGPKYNHTIPTTQTHTHIHIINTHTHTSTTNRNIQNHGGLLGKVHLNTIRSWMNPRYECQIVIIFKKGKHWQCTYFF